MNRIQGLACLSEYQEGEAIAQYIKVAHRTKKLRDIAILYRAHYQSRAIEEALIRQSIPYVIIGGTEFYERKEIKDILAYLRLIVNPYDRPSFFRVINAPTRGLGEKFEELFYNQWQEQPLMTFMQVGEYLLKNGGLPKARREALTSFLNVFSNTDASERPSIAIQRVIQATLYYAYIKAEHEEKEAEERIENVKELLHAVTYLEAQKPITLDSFLEDIALMHEKISNKKSADAITLMTLHAAKGLEFDTVIITGLEEGILPNGRSLNLLEHVEEERRLFYVGITRAQEHLLITHARHRYAFGQMTDQARSRFLDEIPQSYLPMHSCSFWKTIQFTEFFNLWLYGNEQKKNVVYVPSKIEKLSSGTKESTKSTTANHGAWRKNQPVHHKKFGIGTIETIEDQGDGNLYIQAKFKTGTKKISANFLEPI